VRQLASPDAARASLAINADTVPNPVDAIRKSLGEHTESTHMTDQTSTAVRQASGYDDGSMNRLTRCASLSNTLARLTDEALADLVAKAPRLHAGVGGRSVLLTIDSTPIFVKRIALTDLERRQEHVRSTANLFDIPGL
jgi:hypothetical protein